MKTILLMRHAKSSWAESGVDDFDRTLNDRGRKSAPRMAAWIIENQLVPDVICSSTAKRALQTTELIAKSFAENRQDRDIPIHWEKELYLAPPDVIARTIEGISNEYNRVLLIAHNPGLEHWVGVLRNEFTPFPTAAIACFECGVDDWSEIRNGANWKLIQFACPKEI